MDNNNFINIRTEQLGDDTIKANFKSDVKNFDQLISLGGAILQTYITSATELVQRNTDEEVPKDFIKLTIFEALINKLENLLDMQEDTNKEDAVDSFLKDIINGRNKN